MYTRQKRSQMAIGYNGLGQAVANATARGVNPVDGSTVTFTGSAPNVSNAATVLSILTNAVNASKNAKPADASKLLATAKSLIPGTGSLKDQVSSLVAQAEGFMGQSSTPIPAIASNNAGLILSAAAVAAFLQRELRT